MTMFAIIVLMGLFGWFLWCKITGEKELNKIDNAFNKIMEMDDESFKEWYEREML